MIEVTKLEFASASTTYYGTYLPSHAQYLQRSDFDHITKELNKAKSKKTSGCILALSKYLKIFFFIVVIGGPIIINKVDIPVSSWILYLIYAGLIVALIMTFNIGSGDKRKVKEYVKQTCAQLSTELSPKGIVVLPNYGIREIIISYSPDISPSGSIITVNPGTSAGEVSSSHVTIPMDNIGPSDTPPAYSFK
ncbi:hypothetical protein HDV04_001828 [Boothiomyces sp. JEL0838]|nr:hypothetical protein HDV04_001828 [Boothiomyces sp. JEL0838]